MKKINFAALLVFVAACSVLAARMTITSYGVPHRYPIGPFDQITFDATGLVATITSPGSPQPVVTKYYLGYSNSVVLDTVGGPITSLNVNATDNTTIAIDFNSIDSIVFRPSVDSTGDDDADGLSNYLELMLYHTDPEKSSTSGDGIVDKWKVSHQSNGMLVADLPELSVAMAKFPQVWLVTSLDSTASVENTVSNTSGWGNQEQSTTSTTGSQTASNEFGVSFAEEMGYSWQFGSVGAHVTFTMGQQYSHTWQQEVSQEVASSRQSSYNQTLGQTQTAIRQAGKTISGGKITAMLNLKNTGAVGFTMTDPQFTLYGITFVNGVVAETPICNLATAPELNGSSSVFSINPGATAVAGVQGSLTLAEVAYIGTFPILKVSCTSENISYNPTLSATPMNLSDVMTNVRSATAQVIVDFDNELAGQQSPLSRYVATLNKYNPANPTVAGYGPVYLGEMLTEMGLTYHFDSLGFVDVNGLKRGAANDFFSRRWITMIIHAAGGAQPGDTGVVNVGANGGPDSVVVKTGDIVYVCYSGDDDRDSVPNCVAKLYGISDTTKSKKWHDFDGDGVSNFQEIYGWVPIGGTDTVHTDPANPDCDGDGILDGADPYPLIPHLTNASNLLSFSTLDNTVLIETIQISPQSSFGALTRPLPAFPRYYADLDSMPLHCVVVQNSIDSIPMVYDTTFKDTVSTSPLTTRSRYRLMSTSLAQHVLALGPDTLTVVTQPMTGGSPKTWKISGISTLENVMGAPQASNLLPANVSSTGSRWARIDISVQMVSEQIAADPRTSGIIVFRSSGPNSDTFDLTSRNSPLGAGEKIGTQSSWEVDTVLSALTANVSYTSTNLNSGTVWNYRSVPYNVANGNIYYYGASAGFTSAKTWEIWVSTTWDSFTCALSNFGSATVLAMNMRYRNVNGDTGALSTAWVSGPYSYICANGTKYPVKWVDSAQVHVHDSVWTNISMLNFTQNVQLLTINVDNLAAGGFTDPLKVFSGGVVAGQGAFWEPGRDGSATCTNVQFTNNIAVPTASSPNAVTFQSTTHTETNWGAGTWAANIGPMKFRWWFK